jgi:hypothetical protein
MRTITKTTVFLAILLMLTGTFVSCDDKENPSEPFLTIAETPITATAEAGTYTISVHSSGAWTAVVEDTENSDWCTLSDTTGINKGTIVVNVAINTAYTTRSATVKITSENFTKSVIINQKGFEVLGDYPQEVSLTEYPFPFHRWINLDYSKKFVIVINSKKELQHYTGTYPTLPVDFSQQTVLIAYDRVDAAPCYGSMESSIFQNATDKNEYMLKKAVCLGTIRHSSSWLVSYLVPKLPKVTLDVEYTHDYYDDTHFPHDESASIIGKWKLMITRSAGFMVPSSIFDYSQHNVVYEFKENGILVISAETDAHLFPGIGEHSYLFVDNEHGMPDLPYGLKIKEMASWYRVSSERLIIDDSPIDGNTYFFFRIN